MRRSPPGRACLLGIDMRKRPLADITPDEPSPEERERERQREREREVNCVMVVVEETPRCEQVVCRNHNTKGVCQS
jgi:hypothetical protein